MNCSMRKLFMSSEDISNNTKQRTGNGIGNLLLYLR